MWTQLTLTVQSYSSDTPIEGTVLLWVNLATATHINLRPGIAVIHGIVGNSSISTVETQDLAKIEAYLKQNSL